MSRHVWLAKKLESWTIRDGSEVFTYAWLVKKLDYRLACMFVGYYLERSRQQGSVSMCWLMKGVVKSRYRFSKGKNAEGYFKAGEMVVTGMASDVGMDADTPACIVADYLKDSRDTQLTLIEKIEIRLPSEFLQELRDAFPRSENIGSAITFSTACGVVEGLYGL